MPSQTVWHLNCLSFQIRTQPRHTVSVHHSLSSVAVTVTEPWFAPQPLGMHKRVHSKLWVPNSDKWGELHQEGHQA